MDPVRPPSDEALLVSPKELAGLLKSEPGLALLDVRSEVEHRMLAIEGSRLATHPLVEEIFSAWPKDARIVVYDHFGRAGLDAARALAGRGFTRARGLAGGIDAWSQDVDPLVPRYP